MRNAHNTGGWTTTTLEWRQLEGGQVLVLLLCAVAVFACFFELGHRQDTGARAEALLPITQSSRADQMVHDRLSDVPALAVRLSSGQSKSSDARRTNAVKGSSVSSAVSTPVVRHSTVVPTPPPTVQRRPSVTPTRPHAPAATGHGTTPHGAGSAEGNGSFDSSG